MITETFEKSLKSFQRRAPFRPFLMELKSGSVLRIEHPEAVATYYGSAIHMSRTSDYTLFDADSVAKLMDEPKASAANEAKSSSAV